MYKYVRKIIILLSFFLIYDLRRLKVAIPKGKSVGEYVCVDVGTGGALHGIV